MKIKFIVYALLIVITFISCDSSTEPTEFEGITNITETSLGSSEPIGNIDRNDWSKYSYHGIFFGKNFWFRENDKIVFYSNIPNRLVTSSIYFYNSSSSIINLTSNIRKPFSVTNSSFDLHPYMMNPFVISYSLPDTSNYSFQDTLFLNFSTGEKYNILLVAFAQKDTVIRQEGPEPSKGGMYPAYPNPTSSNITIRILLPSSNHTLITVNNKFNKLVKTIKDETLSAGSYSFVWDLTDNNGKKLNPGYYRVFFKAGTFQDTGDIKIE